MQYRNRKTGTVIDVDAKMGGNWEPVETPAARKAETKKPEPARKTARVKK